MARFSISYVVSADDFTGRVTDVEALDLPTAMENVRELPWWREGYRIVSVTGLGALADRWVDKSFYDNMPESFPGAVSLVEEK